MLALERPTAGTVTTTGWFPAGLEPTVHVTDVGEVVPTAHGIPPTVTVVWPVPKFVPEITND